jgi:hypothetical protein
MTTTELLAHTNSPQQAASVLEVARVADRDLAATTRVVAYSWDPARGYVTLESGGYINVVLTDDTITDEAP